MNDWMEYLVPIKENFRGSSKEKLSMGEIDTLSLIIRAKINFHQGNITEKEYTRIVEVVYAPFSVDNKWRDMLQEGIDRRCSINSER
jgi:hypothetical protein